MKRLRTLLLDKVEALSRTGFLAAMTLKRESEASLVVLSQLSG